MPPRYPLRAGRLSRDPRDLRRERPTRYSDQETAADRGVRRGTATEMASLASFAPGPVGVLGGGAEAALEGRGLPGVAIAAGAGALPGPAGRAIKNVVKFPKAGERIARQIGKIKERVNQLDEQASQVQETLRTLQKQKDGVSQGYKRIQGLGLDPNKTSQSELAMAIRQEGGLSADEARQAAQQIKYSSDKFFQIQKQQNELRSNFLEIDKELAELRQQEESLMSQIQEGK